jgi:RNA polymerase sigma-70 factor (sigma-E family)
MRAEAKQEFTEYVTARLASLRRLAYILYGDESHADDLVQMTITKLYLRWGRLRDIAHLDQYVRTMLLRTFLDERRRPWARVGLAPDPPDLMVTGGDRLDDHLTLRAALARVPRRQQAVLVLRFVYDLPVNEVATLLHCSPGTVKSQSARGLATLRRLLDDNAPTTLRKVV